jgi:hypothetical protein
LGIRIRGISISKKILKKRKTEKREKRVFVFIERALFLEILKVLSYKNIPKRDTRSIIESIIREKERVRSAALKLAAISLIPLPKIIL